MPTSFFTFRKSKKNHCILVPRSLVLSQMKSYSVATWICLPVRRPQIEHDRECLQAPQNRLYTHLQSVAWEDMSPDVPTCLFSFLQSTACREGVQCGFTKSVGLR